MIRLMKPTPLPPNTMLSSICEIGVMLASGVRLSCMASMVPVVKAVVEVTNMAVSPWPNRSSWPSRLPCAGFSPSAFRSGLPSVSPTYAIARNTRKKPPITQKSVHACFMRLIMMPSM